MSAPTSHNAPAHASSKPTLADHATSSKEYTACLTTASTYVLDNLGSADYAIVLGSGLMDFVDKFSQNPAPKSISYSEVPYMPGTNVPGHSGRIYLGDLPTGATKENPNGTLSKVMCFAGRVHAYEGWSACEYNFIVRLAHRCGVKVLLLTNSAGGALAGMTEGSIMMIRDHIRFSSSNPLKDICEDSTYGPKYCLSSQSYSSRIHTIMKNAGEKLNIPVLSGTYCWTSGPAYETPSEVKAGQILSIGSLGGAFGMSTVPEVLAATNLGLEVFAVSLCTNLAAGLSEKELTHGDVKAVAELAGPRFQNLLVETFRNLSVDEQRNGGEKKSQSSSSSAANEKARPSSSSSSSTIAPPATSLYQISGWTPSVAEVQEGVEKLKAKQVGLTSCLLVQGGFGQNTLVQSLLTKLTNTTTTPLTELCSSYATKYPSTVSSYFRNGLLVTGTITSISGIPKLSSLVYSTNSDLSGMTSGEYAWLVQVLKLSGVAQVITCGVAVETEGRDISVGEKNGSSSSSSSTPSIPSSNKLVLLEDVLNRQVDLAPACVTSSNGGNVNNKLIFSRQLIELFEKSFLSNTSSASASGTKLTVGSLLTFAGPMLPTQAELNISTHAGCQLANVTNMTLQDIAVTVGVELLAVMRCVAEIGELPDLIGESDSLKKEDSNTTTINVLTETLMMMLHDGTIKNTPANAAASSSSSSLPSFPSSSSGLAPVTYLNPFLGYSDIQQAADALLTAMKLPLTNDENSNNFLLSSAVFMEGLFTPAQMFPGYELQHTTPLSSIPHFTSYLKGEQGKAGLAYPYAAEEINSAWSVSLIHLPSNDNSTQTQFLLIHSNVNTTGTKPAYHGLNFITRCMSYLIAKKKGVLNNILFVTPLASCSPTISTGDLVVTHDHINLTGQNPLFGENLAELGPRFNDMSCVYRKAGIDAFTNQQDGLAAVKPTLTVSVVHPSLSSLSESSLARVIHGTTLTSGLIPQATIAKHSDLFISSLGWVYKSAGTTNDLSVISATPTASVYSPYGGVKPTKEQLKMIGQHVVSAIPKLREAARVQAAGGNAGGSVTH